MTKHTEECLRLQGKYEEKREQYKKQYPNYCRACGGLGYHTFRENMAPISSGRSMMMEMSKPCTECTGKGLCPGCMQPVFSEEDFEKMDGSGKVYCEQCGWIDDEQHGIPDEWDCWGACYYEQERERKANG